MEKKTYKTCKVIIVYITFFLIIFSPLIITVGEIIGLSNNEIYFYLTSFLFCLFIIFFFLETLLEIKVKHYEKGEDSLPRWESFS